MDQTSQWLNRGSNLLISVSGIRGIIPNGIDTLNTVQFLRAFSAITGKRIIIGRDTRPNGSFLHHLLIATLIGEGKEILDAGILPTPTLKCAVKSLKADAGIMISASHNPLEWNGFKFMDSNGSFWDKKKQSQWLEKLMKLDPFVAFNSKRPIVMGSCKEVDAIDLHVEAVLKYISDDLPLIRKKKYTVVVDAGAGAGYKAIPKLLEQLGCKVVLLNCAVIPDMKAFPREPEPNQVALRHLAKLTKKEKAALGCGLDPDADRLVLASSKRGAISEEYTLPLALLGLEPIFKKYQSQGKQGTMVFNLSTSNLCDWLANTYNARVLRVAVGEANVVEEMTKSHALFGGEGNGGVIVPDIPSFGRDPLVGLALILAAMARAKLDNVEELLKGLPPLFMVKKKYKISNVTFQELTEKFLLEFPSSKVNTLDGLHLTQPDTSWLHLRPSNTEPALRLIVQAPQSKRLKQLLKTSQKVLAKFN